MKGGREGGGAREELKEGSSWKRREGGWGRFIYNSLSVVLSLAISNQKLAVETSWKCKQVVYSLTHTHSSSYSSTTTDPKHKIVVLASTPLLPPWILSNA